MLDLIVRVAGVVACTILALWLCSAGLRGRRGAGAREGCPACGQPLAPGAAACEACGWHAPRRVA